MRLGARSTRRLANQLGALEPECLGPTATTENPRDGATRETFKLFVVSDVLGVEARVMRFVTSSSPVSSVVLSAQPRRISTPRLPQLVQGRVLATGGFPSLGFRIAWEAVGCQRCPQRLVRPAAGPSPVPRWRRIGTASQTINASSQGGVARLPELCQHVV